MKTLLEEFCLEPLLIRYFASVHHPNGPWISQYENRWQEGGGRGNLDYGLPKDIVKGGGMGKHGFWIGRKRRVAREEGVPKVFRGTDKGSTQLMSPLGNEETLLMARRWR
jgi:hypothetical protein